MINLIKSQKLKLNQKLFRKFVIKSNKNSQQTFSVKLNLCVIIFWQKKLKAEAFKNIEND